MKEESWLCFGQHLRIENALEVYDSSKLLKSIFDSPPFGKNLSTKID